MRGSRREGERGRMGGQGKGGWEGGVSKGERNGAEGGGRGGDVTVGAVYGQRDTVM